MRASLTAASPPTSDQPNSPAVCNVTPLNAAGVNPSRAALKSSDVIVGLPANLKIINIARSKMTLFFYKQLCFPKTGYKHNTQPPAKGPGAVLH